MLSSWVEGLDSLGLVDQRVSDPGRPASHIGSPPPDYSMFSDGDSDASS